MRATRSGRLSTGVPRVRKRRSSSILAWQKLTKDEVGDLGTGERGGLVMHARLLGCSSSVPEVEGAELEGAELEGAELEGAELEGAELEGADLEEVKLEGDVSRSVLSLSLWEVLPHVLSMS